MLNQRTTGRAPGHPRMGPDKEQLKKYLNRGMTQQEIADDWAKKTGNRVTRSAISMATTSFGLKPSNPRPRYADLIPWRVKTDHSTDYNARMLRAKARIDGKKKSERLTDPEYRRVMSWLEELKEAGAVVDYSPKLGFFWMERDPLDGPGALTRSINHPRSIYDGK